MNKIIYWGVLTGISMWEVWMCEEFLHFFSALNKRKKWIRRLLEIGSIFLLGFGMGLVRGQTFLSPVLTLFCILLTACTMKILMRTSFWFVIGMTGIYYVIISLLDIFFAFLYLENMGTGNAFLSVRQLISVEGLSEWNILIYLLSRVLILTIGLLFGTSVRKLYQDMSVNQKIFLAVPVILYMLLMRYYQILYHSDFGDGRIQGLTESISIVILFVFLLIGSAVYVRYQLLEKEAEWLLIRNQVMEANFREMMRSRQVVHDMKNHVLLMQKYEEEGRREELHRYLQLIGKELFREKEKIRTGLEELDFLLNQKIRLAESRQIEVRWDLPHLTSVPLTIQEQIALFGNLLDNAVEACKNVEEGKRWIYLSIKKKNQLFFLQMENSMETMKKKEFGRRTETKELHGYGLKSVRRIVNLHDGELFCEEKDGTFCVKVLLVN